MAPDIETLTRQAVSFHQSGDRRRAEELYLIILSKDPDHSAANHFYGLLVHEKGDFQNAVRYLEKSLRANPPPNFYANIGGAFAAEWRLDEAEKYYEKAMTLDPDMPEASLGLGVVRQKQGDYAAAEKYYRQAMKTDDDRVIARTHWNLAQVLLLTGRYEEGWKEFEWRPRKNDLPRFFSPNADPFSGGKRAALIVNEMGYGDIIQFIRFFGDYKARRPEIDFQCVCPEPLKRLFIDSLGAENLSRDEQWSAAKTAIIPVMSLPRLLKLDENRIPGKPYLKVSERLTTRWKQEMDAIAKPGLRVGVAWAGSPTHANDRVRSIPLSALVELFKLPNIAFFSLQKGPGVEQLQSAPESLRPLDLSDKIQHFADLAAITRNLDIVISVDTAPLHLAGALGKKTYGLIHFSPDWRWGARGDRSLWYDSVTLLRQTKPFDWTDCVRSLRDRLEAFRQSG